MKQHREREGKTGSPPPAAGGNASLSQILVRREKRKTGSGDSMKCGGLVLKPSREYLSDLGGSDRPSVGERAPWGEEEGGRCCEGGGSEMAGDGVSGAGESSSGQWGGRETEAVWSKMMECMKTASLTGQITMLNHACLLFIRPVMSVHMLLNAIFFYHAYYARSATFFQNCSMWMTWK